MKYALIALLSLCASPAAFASAPHCPPGTINVWGACIDQGSGIFNRIFHGHHGHATCGRQPVAYAPGPHCPPGTVNVWGACLTEGYGVFNPIFNGHR